MPTSVGRVGEPKTQMIQSVQVLIAEQIDRSPMTTVAARRSTAGYKLFSAKRDTAITSTSGLDLDDRFVDEGQFREGC